MELQKRLYKRAFAALEKELLVVIRDGLLEAVRDGKRRSNQRADRVQRFSVAPETRGQVHGQQVEEFPQAALAEQDVGGSGDGVEGPACGGGDAEGEAEAVDHGQVADAAQNRVHQVPDDGVVADLAEDLGGEDALVVQGVDHGEEQAEETTSPPRRRDGAEQGRSCADDDHGDEAEEEFVFGEAHCSSKE